MRDTTSLLRSATRRAKSDVANKLIGMFLHELSARLVREWGLRVESEKYGEMVRSHFENRCPYCLLDLSQTTPIVEHLDGMNRYRAGLHVPGNVLIACKRCNSEKRRDDSLHKLVLADSGWASFLSHDMTRCAQPCASCRYWAEIWEDAGNRQAAMAQNLSRIRSFRLEFPAYEALTKSLAPELSSGMSKLYSDCQQFAETEIKSLMAGFLTRLS